MINRVLLSLTHALQRSVDRRVLRSVAEGPGHWFRRSLVAGFLLAITISATYALHQRALQAGLRAAQSEAEGAERADFLDGLPSMATIEGERLYHLCTGERTRTISRNYYRYTRYFSRTDFEEAIQTRNAGAIQDHRCTSGERIAIPEPMLQAPANRPLGWDRDEPVRAVYLQGGNTRPDRLREEVARLRAIGGNGIVFDVKDIIGVVNYRSNVDEVERYRRHEPPIYDLPKVINYLHSENIYVIARMALFQDENLAIQRPDLAIRDRNSEDGRLLVKDKPLWVDAGQPEVRQYNWKIVNELIEMGVDEIQFDYVRYPAEGDLSGVVYHNAQSTSEKTGHLKHFLMGAWLAARNTGVHLSIDIFGIVAWGEDVDIRTTGQRVEELAHFVDIISPMLYPSHFGPGFDGFENPADHGYHFYYEGVKRIHERTNGQVAVRPWMQAFRWRVTDFNEEYIVQQILGSRAGGGSGWMMWNAGNQYGLVYRALRGSGGVPSSQDREQVAGDADPVSSLNRDSDVVLD